MVKDLREAILWWVRVGGKAFVVSPAAILATVLFNIFSQVFLLVSFLLPLKVVMLLGVEGEVRFLPESLSGMGREELVLALTGGAVLSFLLHVFFARLGRRYSDSGVARLLTDTSKITLFENQDELAGNSYRRYNEALAKFTFSFIAAAAICLLYLDVAAVFLASLIVSLLVLLGAGSAWSAISEDIKTNFRKYVTGTSAAIFFVIFSYIVADFLWMSHPEFIVALLVIILSRQMLSQLSAAFVGSSQLFRQKRKISSLFFHRQVFDPLETQSNRSGVWSIFRSMGDEKSFPRAILSGICEGRAHSVRWHQGGLRNVLTFDFYCNKQAEWYFCKVFEGARNAEALHERTLLLGGVERLPAARLEFSDEVGGYSFHIFKVDSTFEYLKEDFETVQHNFLEQMLCYEPPQTLVERYIRSKPMLWGRLDPIFFQRMLLVADRQDIKVIRSVYRRLEVIRNILKGLPVAICNSKNSNELLAVNADGQLIHFDWGKWSLEPVGSGWPIKSALDGKMGEAIRRAGVVRKNLEEINVRDCQVAALSTALEKACRRERYRDAISLVARIEGIL